MLHLLIIPSFSLLGAIDSIRKRPLLSLSLWLARVGELDFFVRFRCRAHRLMSAFDHIRHPFLCTARSDLVFVRK